MRRQSWLNAREFGFTFLHGFVPTFYVDVTDIFMASRRARVVTAVSGALVHLVLGAGWLLVAVAAPPGSFLQAFAAASGLIQWQALVIALYPFCFIEMDGYHVLVDVLGVPTLKSDALAFTGAVLRGASQDFAACGTTTLDRFGAELLAALLAVPATRAEELRRDLRKAGIAAFGVLQAA